MGEAIDVALESLIKCVVALAMLMAAAGYLTLAERKILGRMQARYGPNRAGPLGLLQPLADGIKLLLKEPVTPREVKLPVYLAAPAISLFVAIMAFAIVPIGPPFYLFGKWRYLTVANVNIGLLYLLAILSLGVYGIVLGAWSSSNRYSLLGGLRSSAQMISYELSLGLALIAVVLLAGTLSPIGIVQAQNHNLTWFVLLQPIGFLLFVCGGFAETNRAPFDLAEAEQELTGGYHTEYAGMRFGLYFIAEYMNMFTVSALVATLFLGGWVGIGNGILFTITTAAPWAQLLGIFWFAVKVAAFLFFYIWIRATLPRIRYDQLMWFGWKVLLPLSVLNMLVTALYVSLS